MAQRTNTDLIRELVTQMAAVAEQIKILEQREKELRQEGKDITEKLDAVHSDIAVLKDFKQRVEEKERRTWFLYVAVVGSLLASIGSFVLSFLLLLRMVRPPATY